MEQAAVVLNAAAAAPAGGAATDQVVGATVAAVLVTSWFAWLLGRYRAGGAPRLRAFAAWAAADTGFPAWVALPGFMLGNSLLVAVIGMYWDISLHIDEGRDAGPLANPAHYLILVGLFGVLFSGVLASALTGDERPSASAIRLPNGWWAPAGSVMIAACGAVSLVAFPLDDLWHRLFGQDVTLWGPTHLLLIGGAAFSVIGHWVLQTEGERARTAARALRAQAPVDPMATPRMRSERRRRVVRAVVRVREYMLSGALLGALFAFQAEFDFGVEQFRLVWHPLLISLGAALGLVACRLRLGRGGAIGAFASFMLIRGFLSVLVGPVLGQTTPHFPILLVEALIVEAVGLRFGRSRPLTLGLVAGTLIGTAGFAAQFVLSDLDYIPWPKSLLVEGLACAFVAGGAGGVLGGAVGRAVSGVEPAERLGRAAVVVAGVAVAGVMAWAIPMPAPDRPIAASVKLSDVPGEDGRWVRVAVTLDPPDAANDARWFNATAWQGGGSVVTPMVRTSAGSWVSEGAVPVHGDGWKAMLRLHSGRSLSALPIYMPEDTAIPAAAIDAPAAFTRSFMTDSRLFQREQKQDVPASLKTAGYLTVLAIWLAMVAVVCWGLSRMTPGRPRRPRGGKAASPVAGAAA